jgi:hypothetical protein
MYTSVFKRGFVKACERDRSLWEWIWMYWHGVHETRAFRGVIEGLRFKPGVTCDGAHEKMVACL